MSSPKVTHFPCLDASDHVVYLFSFWYSVFIQSDLPCWLSGKESTCNAGDRVWSLVRKIPWRRKWLPTLVLLPGESHGQRSYSPWGLKELGMTEWLTTLSLTKWNKDWDRFACLAILNWTPWASVYIIDKSQRRTLALQHILSLLLMWNNNNFDQIFLLVLALGIDGFYPFHGIFFFFNSRTS